MRIGDHQNEVNALIRELFPEETRARRTGPESNGNGSAPHGPVENDGQSYLEDQEVLARVFKDGEKFRSAYAGDLGPYPSTSEAVSALLCKLAFYTSGDTGQMERLIRSSGLASEKFDTPRGPTTWLGREIERALGMVPERYSPGAPVGGRRHRDQGRDQAVADDAPSPVEENAPPVAEGVEDRTELPPDLLLTDLGNADRFAARFEKQLIYSPAIGGYGEYRAGRYGRDDLGKRFELAKSVPLEFMVEAGTIAAADQDTAKKYAKHGIASAARPRLESMVALAHSDPRIAVASEDLDGDPYLFNCATGTIDLRTGELRPHDHADRLTKISPVRYQEGAGCPTWHKFLQEILPEPELQAFMRRWFGWCLTGVVNAEVLPIFYGTGANGKSTMVNVLLELLGDYGMQAPQDLLMVKRREHPTELADLHGRRLVASAEIEEGVRLNESLVKQLTGRERVRARYMRQDFFEFDPTHKLVLLTNHKPTIRGSDKGIWRRLKVVPFEVTIADADQDKHLADKLRAELPGILAWAIEGCLEWQRDGLGEPQKVRDASAEYQSEQDVIGAFLDECCEVVEDDAVYTLFKVLFGTYQEWCKDLGERAMKRNDFIERLKERGFPPDNGPKNVSIRRRIRLRDDAPRPDGGGDRLFTSSHNKHTNPDGGTNRVNPEGKRVNDVNPENSCKTEEAEEKVNGGYRGFGMNADCESSRGGHSETPLTRVNPLTLDALTDHERRLALAYEADGMSRTEAISTVVQTRDGCRKTDHDISAKNDNRGGAA